MANDTRMSETEAERVEWFERCTSDSLSDFDYEMNASENKNTKRKTETDMRIFSSFLLNMNENRPAETIEPVEMDRYLTTFFSIIKKHDGNEYEPASLRGMLCSIERYLRVRNYPRSLTRDIVFISTRNTLRDRQIVLREIAKSSKRSKQEMLTTSSIDKLKQLYNAREFGPYNPMAVINTLCFAFVVHLKIRKAIDHKQLLWGDIVLTSHNSKEYLCYQPVQGRDFLRQKLSNISSYRIYGQTNTTSPADPVAVYKLYASKRPSQAMSPDSPFYLGLAVNGQAVSHHPQWFRCSPMGVNKLNDLVRMIREITGNLTMSITESVNSIMDTYSSKYPFIQNSPLSHSANIDNRTFNEEEDNNKSDNDQCILKRFEAESGHFNSTSPAASSTHEDFGAKSPNKNYSNITHLDRSATENSSDGEYMNGKNDRRTDTNIETTVSKLDDVKQKLRDTMETLEDGEKQGIADWFMRTYLDKDNVCHKCNTPRHFNIKFTMQQGQREALATVKAAHSGNCERATDSQNIQTTCDNVPDPTDPISTRTCKSPDSEHITKDNNASSESNNVPTSSSLKRKAYEAYNSKSKIPKTLESPAQSVLVPEEGTNDDENTDKLLNSNVKYVSNHCNVSDGSVDCCNLCRREPEVPQWFAPWTLDPRLAFYLRHGIPPYAGYQNLVGSKSASDT